MDECGFLGSLDLASDRPKFKQIADQLRGAIESGQLEEGAWLPSEQKLMDHYGVARMTVRAATRVLQDEGIAVAEHGRGLAVRAAGTMRLPGDVRSLLADLAGKTTGAAEAVERARQLLEKYQA